MTQHVAGSSRRSWRVQVVIVSAVVVSQFLGARPADARVKKIVVDKKVSPAFDGKAAGSAGPYETVAGRVFGELDPTDPHNAVITDIRLAPRNAAGKVEYVATFFLVKPIDMSKSSRLLWQDVPNRGGRVTIGLHERADGDVGLSSGWQGDSSGGTAPGPNNDYVVVPVARNPDGSSITGLVMARILNASGRNSKPLMLHSNPVPYRPASLVTTTATLTTHASETIDGKVGATSTVASTDWAWATCSPEHPFPGTPDPTQICLRNGFDPALLYQLVFTAKDPPVLGIGFAAFRDMASFFKNATKDDEGTLNPVGGQISWVITRGVSQSGNFVRALLHLGFTQDEANRKVYDGAWPIIAGRRIALNARFAMPDGVLKLYEPGSEGPQSWTAWPDPVRGLPASGILDRCSANHTCPKIIEHFGAAEVWGLKLTPEWVGTSADADIPLPANVRRYYIPGTQHGGGSGGFSLDPLAAPSCPSVDYGRGIFAGNPVPHTETVNALRFHFRNWVMKDAAPPASRWPTLKDKTLVDATKAAMGFPTIPGVPPTAPTGFINPLLDYDWGPDFNPTDASGVFSLMPPTIKHVIALKVPRVDADGNELGGVPVVLRDAPLGTYLGWNVTAAGFHQGQICNYAGGMIPFAANKAARLASGDPRLSLEERYVTHDGYVQAVRAAAAKAVAQSFLLQPDADALVAQAAASRVLLPADITQQAPSPVAPRVASAARPAVVPKTPDGRPDLQGLWDFAQLTPFERPDRLAGKSSFADDEAEEFAQKRVENDNKDRRDGTAAADVERAYNDFWWDFGTRIAKQTSLVVDPPTGRVPPLTPAAQARAAARTARYDNPEDRPLAERCILGFNSGPPMVPSAYNNNVQIVQTRDRVLIVNEMIHSARIVDLTGRAHFPGSMRFLTGDSVGRWEGQTLVVDTTNFLKDGAFRGASTNMHLVERFSRVDADILRYEFTVDDPATWTSAWTASIPMTRTDQLMYEYACHEANYGFVGVLKGARFQDRQKPATQK